MRLSFDLRPTRLLVGAGALVLAFAVGAAAASSGAPARTAAGPAAPAVAAAADDATDASAALGLGEDAALVAAIGVDGTADEQAAAPKRVGGILRAIIGKTERAEITVSTAENGQKTILYVRGTFSAASATSVTITLKDGTKQAFTLDATTVVRSAGKVKVIADIPTSGRGLAVGVKNADGTYTAKFVRFAPAK
jgi:hypothetical protein